MNTELIKSKSTHYHVCFLETCPLHTKCLRWLAGYHLPESPHYVTCRNPHAPGGTDGTCKDFKEARTVRKGRGFLTLYENMPVKTARAIKPVLEAHFGHTPYYQYRKGTMALSPKDMEFMERVCRKHGWTEPLVFDQYEEDYVW